MVDISYNSILPLPKPNAIVPVDKGSMQLTGCSLEEVISKLWICVSEGGLVSLL